MQWQRLKPWRPALPRAEATRSLPLIVFLGVAEQKADLALLAQHPLQGVCPVCQQSACFRGFTDNLRESGHCDQCGSFNRQRQLAHVMRQRLPFVGQGCWPFPPGFSIYNTESTGALHKALLAAQRPDTQYQFSEYFGPQHEPGSFVGEVRHESLEALSFSAESFDLVLSSDVLEHLPKPYVAHTEILRVLKPGGRHLFTVPCDLMMARDDVRASLHEGEVVYHADKLFHGDPVRPDEGILVWTIFGQQMLARMTEMGYSMTAWVLQAPELGIIGDHAIVFEARKPG